MNVALRHSPSPNRALPAAAGRLSRVAIFDDLAAVEPLWRGLEAQDCLTTPFQRYDFLGPWQRHVGARAGVLPFIVVGFDALGETICLWPLGRRQAGPLRVVEFLGGKQASFKLPIWRRETAAGATKAMLDAIVAQLGSSADALILRNQPRAWEGIANPIALLPHQPSPDAVHSGKLLPDFEALAREQISSAKRKKIRNRERQLLTHGPVRFWRAQTQAQAHELLAVFHAQKARRMQELGIANVFDEPGVHEFIAEALTSGIASNPAIEFYGLAAGDTTVATWAGVAGGGRFSGTFTSFIHN